MLGQTRRDNEPLPVVDVAEALAEGQQVRFSEQAFEWINACYLYGEPWTYRLPTTLVALDTDVFDILR